MAGLAGVLPRSLQRVECKSRALGADVSLVVYHSDRNVAERALTAAFKALDDLENVLSLYRPDSQLCRLNHDGVLERPHPDLVKVLRSAVDWSRLTDGAFDPTVQPLWNLYSEGGLPDSERLQGVRRFVNWKQVELDAHRIRLGTGQSVTLNG